ILGSGWSHRVNDHNDTVLIDFNSISQVYLRQVALSQEDLGDAQPFVDSPRLTSMFHVVDGYGTVSAGSILLSERRNLHSNQDVSEIARGLPIQDRHGALREHLQSTLKIHRN